MAQKMLGQRLVSINIEESRSMLHTFVKLRSQIEHLRTTMLSLHARSSYYVLHVIQKWVQTLRGINERERCLYVGRTGN